MGERPPPKEAAEIRGAVLEVPVPTPGERPGVYVDTLAAYSDGRARYVNGQQGAMIIWEATDHQRITALVRDVIAAAEPLAAKAAPVEKHRPMNPQVVRVTLLTYGGLRVVEAKESDVTDGHALGPVYAAGTRLLYALIEEDDKAKGKRP